jgi:2-hydroxychromene-2-carboxylate isomerase
MVLGSPSGITHPGAQSLFPLSTLHLYRVLVAIYSQDIILPRDTCCLASTIDAECADAQNVDSPLDVVLIADTLGFVKMTV